MIRLAAATLALAAFWATPAFAAAAPAATAAAAPAKKPVPAKEVPGELVEFETSDGWTIVGRYSPSKEEDQLTFILLHDSRGRLQNWYYLARKMAARGIGYLAIDMRGHGASVKAPAGKPASWREFIVSKRDNPYEGIREDIAAAAKFLESKGVPPEAVALGGADLGGSLVLKYAALQPEIAMVFVLSPGMSYRDIATVNAVRAYKDRPILFVVAEDDRKSAAETSIMAQFARQSAGEENVTVIHADRGHGTRMLVYNKGLIDSILEWVDTPVKAPELSTSTDTLTGLDGALPPEGDELPPVDPVEEDPSMGD